MVEHLLTYEFGLPEQTRSLIARIDSYWELDNDFPDVIAELGGDSGYRDTAREIVRTAALRLAAIQSGAQPYVAEKAFSRREVEILQLACAVLLAYEPGGVTDLIGHILHDSVVAPDPAARTVPSQACFFAMTRCVVAHPNPALILALRDAEAGTRHAGVKKKAGRVRAQAMRAQAETQTVELLTPDFGLDPTGGIVLDFGRRQFTVRFDELLRPIVYNEDGSMRKTLPKVTTEPGLSETKRFSALKRGVKQVASLEIRRLEAGMVNQTPWPRDAFEFMVVHPLLRQLVRRLVWMPCSGSLPDEPRSFRVAEDGSLADINDADFTLDSGSLIVPHPLILGPDKVEQWTGVFSDYELLQPFPQLARDVHTIGEIDAYEKGATTPGRLLGLLGKTWSRDSLIGDILVREFPTGNRVEVHVDPGVPTWDPMLWPDQTIKQVLVGALTSVEASEVVRDLAYLVP